LTADKQPISSATGCRYQPTQESPPKLVRLWTSPARRKVRGLFVWRVHGRNLQLLRRQSAGMIVDVEASSANKRTVSVGAPTQNRFASFCWMLLYFCHRPVCEMQKNK
jgi:hypothetical protein